MTNACLCFGSRLKDCGAMVTMSRWPWMYSTLGVLSFAVLYLLCTKDMVIQPRFMAYRQLGADIAYREAQMDEKDRCQFTMLRVIQELQRAGVCSRCHASPKKAATDKMSQAELCKVYEDNGKLEREAWVNVLGAEPDDDNVTLVTQTSFDRLDRFKYMVKHWPGPISVAFYLEPVELWELFQAQVCDSAILRQRTNIHYHISFVKGEFFPVNFMRNLALNNTQSRYVYLTDVDAMPSYNSYSVLNEYAQQGVIKPDTALVVPAFGAVSWRDPQEFSYPLDKELLQELLDKGKLDQFMVKGKPTAHRATNYTKWMTANDTYEIQYEQDFEPYVVMHRASVPSYDERFIGRNRNKLSHLEEVNAKGISFMVAPELFTIHINHENRMKDIREARKYIPCAMDVYGSFHERLKKMYPNAPPPSVFNKDEILSDEEEAK